jgi:hypothetical protein
MIGSNPFRSSAELLEELREKLYPKSLVKPSQLNLILASKLKPFLEVKGKEGNAPEALSPSEQFKFIFEKSAITEAKDAVETKEIIMNTHEILKKELKAADLHIVMKEITSTLNKRLGIRNEDETAKLAEVQMGAKLRKHRKMYSRLITSIDDCDYILRARIDRIEHDPILNANILVEIKTRTKKLLKGVPKYEQIQVQTYLELLDLQEAKLIQQYRTDMKIHKIRREQELWNEKIEPGLKTFIKELHDIRLKVPKE